MGLLSEVQIGEQDFAESVRDVFFTMDEHLRYLCWNRAAEELTGIAANEAIGRCFYELFPEAPGTPAEKLYFDVLRTRQPGTIVTEFEGTYYEVTAYPRQHGLAVCARDVTDRERIEHASMERRAREQLLDAEK